MHVSLHFSGLGLLIFKCFLIPQGNIAFGTFSQELPLEGSVRGRVAATGLSAGLVTEPRTSKICRDTEWLWGAAAGSGGGFSAGLVVEPRTNNMCRDTEWLWGAAAGSGGRSVAPGGGGAAAITGRRCLVTAGGAAARGAALLLC